MSRPERPRLQTLLEVRKRAEEEAARALSAARSSRLAAEETVQAAVARLGAHDARIDERAKADAAGPSRRRRARDEALAEAFRVRLEREREVLEKELAARRRALDAARATEDDAHAALVRAATDRKAVEKAKESTVAEDRRREERKEEAEAEDVVAHRGRR